MSHASGRQELLYLPPPFYVLVGSICKDNGKTREESREEVSDTLWRSFDCGVHDFQDFQGRRRSIWRRLRDSSLNRFVIRSDIGVKPDPEKLEVLAARRKWDERPQCST